MLAACSAAPSSVPSSAPPAGAAIHMIQHVVVIQQENRSFDTYFGTYPGADGIPMTAGKPSVCVPDPQNGQCIAPYVDHADVNGGGRHGQTNAAADINGGAINGFIGQAVSAKKGCTDPDTVDIDHELAKLDPTGYRPLRTPLR